MKHFIKNDYSFWAALIVVVFLLPIEAVASSFLSTGNQFYSFLKPNNDNYLLTYTIKDKDTIWNIAKKIGIPIDALIQANQIDSPNLIFPGEKLVIPGNKNLPLKFEVTKLKIPKSQNIQVAYPNQFDVMAPSVPLAYYPAWDYSALNFQFKVSVIFDTSLDFLEWLVTQGYSEKPHATTSNSKPPSPQPINLSQTPPPPFNLDGGENIPTSGISYRSFSPNTVPPPPRCV